MSNFDSYTLRRQVERLDRSKVRLLLEIMGVPYKDQGTKVAEMKKMLARLAAADYDTFSMYYDVIVRRRMPTAEDSAAGSMEKERERILLALHSVMNKFESEYRDNAKAEFDALFKIESKRVSDEARKEIEAAKKQFITHRIKVGKKPAKEIGGVVPAEWGRLCQLVQSRKNILMVGPSGCGKTHIAGMLAEAFDLDYAAQSCSAGISESVFTGWLLPTGNNGKFTHCESEFIRIYENGGLFLLDEFDNSDANLGVFLNMAIAQDHFYVPQRFGKTKVKKHKDFVVVAAANTFGHGADAMYAGRTKLDAATLDRFKMGTVGMTYDHDVESHLVKNQELLNWGWGLRTVIDKHKLQKVLSTRVLQDAGDMMRDHDWTLDEVEKTFFSDWAREELAMIKSDLEILKAADYQLEVA